MKRVVARTLRRYRLRILCRGVVIVTKPETNLKATSEKEGETRNLLTVNFQQPFCRRITRPSEEGEGGGGGNRRLFNLLLNIWRVK